MTQKDIQQLRHTISLLSSMVKGGESHTSYSEKMKSDTIALLNNLEKEQNIWYRLDEHEPPKDREVIFGDSESGDTETALYGTTMPPKYFYDEYDYWTYGIKPPQKN
jgi:hypothetical protein